MKTFSQKSVDGNFKAQIPKGYPQELTKKITNE